MGKALESFKKTIENKLEPHGAIGGFCKRARLSRTTVRGWINGRAPSLDLIERAAAALEMEAWQMIRPAGTESPLVAEILTILPALKEDQLKSILGTAKLFKQINPLSGGHGIDFPDKKGKLS